MARKIPTFWFALILGVLSEAIFGALVESQGSGGPCNINFVVLIFGLWHIPGFMLSVPLLALSRPDNHDLWGYAAMGVIYVTGALTFTLYYYFIIRWLRRPKQKDAG